MDAAEIVVQDVQRNGMLEVFALLREAVCQAVSRRMDIHIVRLKRST